MARNKIMQRINSYSIRCNDYSFSRKVTYEYLWMVMYACRDTKCQKQSLVASAGIVFPRLESGVIEAEVERGIVLRG